MRACCLTAILLLLPEGAESSEQISVRTQDGVVLRADLYGHGEHGIVLAHGGRFDKESWRPEAEKLASAGFRVLAFDFRPSGQSGSAEKSRHLDVLAAIAYLRNSGVTRVSVLGASMGGDFAADACEAEPDKIDRLILLAAGAYTPLTKCKARKLFIMSRDDIIGNRQPRLPAIRRQFDNASPPKRFIALPGSAHAQAIFATERGKSLMQEILRFLRAR